MGAMMNAEPISFRIVRVHPQTSGEYGDGVVGVSGKEPIGQHNHVRYRVEYSGRIQIAVTRIPTSMPMTDALARYFTDGILKDLMPIKNIPYIPAIKEMQLRMA